ncbi:uncharacterized protein LOC106159014 [Lingula anatina]|uniref:Uncharacterized protein LOC106159014 n=1 Tax=Lingula anatina TaxID=7574 RepID=A0A1S3HYI0_LINAN|nr:uncharacterized protein LOC106159014 [Lingula anatina]|eukprot:XP_013390626.1 uncharacterized protein LOC106159014 [Lingula anatina]
MDTTFQQVGKSPVFASQPRKHRLGQSKAHICSLIGDLAFEQFKDGRENLYRNRRKYRLPSKFGQVIAKPDFESRFVALNNAKEAGRVKVIPCHANSAKGVRGGSVGNSRLQNLTFPPVCHRMTSSCPWVIETGHYCDVLGHFSCVDCSRTRKRCRYEEGHRRAYAGIHVSPKLLCAPKKIEEQLIWDLLSLPMERTPLQEVPSGRTCFMCRMRQGTFTMRTHFCGHLASENDILLRVMKRNSEAAEVKRQDTCIEEVAKSNSIAKAAVDFNTYPVHNFAYTPRNSFADLTPAPPMVDKTKQNY